MDRLFSKLQARFTRPRAFSRNSRKNDPESELLDFYPELLESRILLAGSIVVDTLVDELDNDHSTGDLSLREALSIASTQPGADEIRFASAISGGTIQLAPNLGHLSIDSDVSIRTPTQSPLTLDGLSQSRVFQVSVGTTATLDGLTIRNGYSAQHGGAIRNYGDLTVHNSVIQDSSAYAGGGGIYNPGTMTVAQSRFLGNTSSIIGGAIRNSGVLSVSKSEFEDNFAGYFGGAIYNNLSSSSVRISESSFVENSAVGYHGGAFYSQHGSVAIDSSTFAQNSANFNGGGVYFTGLTSSSITNSTLTQNHAGSRGGGLHAHTSDVELLHVTISDNTIAGDYGSGVHIEAGTATQVQNSIIAGNTRNDGARFDFFGANLDSTSVGNVIGQAYVVSGLNAPQNLVNINDPGLTPLASNGGPTQTRALDPTSIAIDYANQNSSNAAGLLWDQRGPGFSRNHGLNSDAGAYETGVSGLSITNGYHVGNLAFTANQLSGGVDVGEFTVSGEYFAVNGKAFGAGELGDGVLVQDDATGSGFLMYSVQDVHARFTEMPVSGANHFVAVRLFNSQWQYNNDAAWVAFDPVTTDTLVASIDFNTDSISNLQGQVPGPTSGLGSGSGSGSSSGGPIVVTTLDDELDGNFSANDLSLREALVNAASLAGPNQIYFSDEILGGTIALNSELTLGSDVEIIAPAFEITLDGGNSNRAFNVTSGVTASVSGLIIGNAHASGYGGAIYNAGDFTLRDSIVHHSAANHGGAIDSRNALTIENSLLVENSAINNGGAVFAYHGSSVNIVDSEFSSNSTGVFGAGVYASQVDVAIANSSISYNVSNDIGGGIFLTSAATATITDTTINENSATKFGGAIYTTGALDITGSELSNNNVESHNGAGIYGFGSDITIHDTNFDNNVAPGSGAAIYSRGTSAALNVSDSGFGNNQSTGSGGAVHVYQGEAHFDGAFFEYNETMASNGGAIYFHSGTTGSISDASFSNNTAKYTGGAIRASGTLAIADSLFHGNTSTSSSGGALYNNGDLTITDSNIVGNAAYNHGGGIHSNGISSRLDIADSSFTLNETERYYGGGIHATYGEFYLTNTDVSNNNAAYYGGGLSLQFLTEAHISNSTISNNAGANGGGIFTYSPLTVSNTQLHGNDARTNAGGAIYSTSTLAIDNSDFIDNRSYRHGGAIYSSGGSSHVSVADSVFRDNAADLYHGGAIYANGQIDVSSTEFSENAAGSYGGALMFWGTTAATISESRFAENYAAKRGGALANSSGVSIADSDLIANSSGEYGGAIFNSNTILTIADSRLHDNSTTRHGGGIYSPGSASSVTVTSSSLLENTAQLNNGGAIYSGGALDIQSSEISDNFAGYHGGGIYNSSSHSSDIKIANSQLDNNRADTGNGGGLWNSRGKVDISGSTFSHNYGNEGGGAYVREGNASTVTNSTFSSNTSKYTGGGFYDYVYGSHGTKLVHVTIADNTSTTNTVGVGLRTYSSSPLSLTSLQNSIVAQNTRSDGAAQDVWGPFESDSDGNVLGVLQSTTGIDVGNNVTDVLDVGLSELAENGGETMTRSLQPDSIAVDAAVSSISQAIQLNTDQRGNGYHRPSGASVDAGAFEYVAPPQPAPFSLDLKNAEAIFGEVRNNVRVEFYRGFMKGIEATEQTLRANPFDQAALLDARLDEAGFESSIAFGKKQISLKQAQLWMRADSTEAAGEVFSKYFSGVTLTSQTVSFDHAWVEIEYDDPSTQAHENTLFSFDPSWKFETQRSPLLAKAQQTHEFSAQNYFAEPRVESPLEFYEDQLRDVLRASNGTTVSDLRRSSIIVDAYDPTYIPADSTASSLGSAPNNWFHKVEIVVAVHAPTDGDITMDILRDYVRSGSPQIRGYYDDVRMTNIALDDILVTYSDDGDYVEFHMDGQRRAPYGRDGWSGDSPGVPILPHHHVTIGVAHSNDGRNFAPSIKTIDAGEALSVALFAGQYSEKSIVQKRGEVVERTLAIDSTLGIDGNTSQNKSVVEATLALVGSEYSKRATDDFLTIGEFQHEVFAVNAVGTGFVTSTFDLISDNASGTPQYYWGLNHPVIPQGLEVDMPGLVGPGFLANLSQDFSELISLDLSYQEHAVIEDLIGKESVSTVKGLQSAVQNGHDVLKFDSSFRVFDYFSNQERRKYSSALAAIDGELNSYPDSTRSRLNELLSGLNDDTFLIVPSEPTQLRDESGNVQFVGDVQLILGTNGHDALISNQSGDPINGGYLTNITPYQLYRPFQSSSDIGQFQYDWGTNLGNVFTQQIVNDYSSSGASIAAPNVQFGNTPITVHRGDPVNVANGNMYRDEVDAAVPAIGMPISFARHYSAQNNDDIGLGIGWTHSFSDQLIVEGRKVVWVTSKGVRHQFTKNTSSGSYNSPSFLYGKLYQINDGFRFVDKHKNTTLFIGDRLSSRTDRLGNGYKVEYENDYISGVKSVVLGEVGEEEMKFEFENGHLDYITLSDGRHLNYSYRRVGADVYLSSFRNLLNHTTRYEHYERGTLKGLIKRIVEADQGWHDYEYYTNRQAFRVTEGISGKRGTENTTTSHSFSYALHRSQSSFVDEKGRVTTYNHDDSARVLSQVNPDHSTEEYTWGEYRDGVLVKGSDYLMTEKVHVDGRVEAFEFAGPARGNLTRSVDKDGVATTYNYETTFGRVTSITVDSNSLPESRVTRSYYDSDGNLVSSVAPDGETTDYSYDEYGQLQRASNPATLIESDSFDGKSLAQWSDTGTWGHSGDSVYVSSAGRHRRRLSMPVHANEVTIDIDLTPKDITLTKPGIEIVSQSDPSLYRQFRLNPTGDRVILTTYQNQENREQIVFSTPAEFTPTNDVNLSVSLDGHRISVILNGHKLEVVESDTVSAIDKHWIQSELQFTDGVYIRLVANNVGGASPTDNATFHDFRIANRNIERFEYNARGQILRQTRNGPSPFRSHFAPSEWELHGNWEHRPSGFALSSSTRSPLPVALLRKPIASSSYTVTSTLTVPPPDQKTGVVARYQNGDYFTLAYLGFNSVTVESTNPDGETERSRFSAGRTFVEGDRVRLSLEVQGNRLRPSINGIPLGTKWAVHTPYPTIGSVGVATRSASGGFHDFSITENLTTNSQYDVRHFLANEIDSLGGEITRTSDAMGRPNSVAAKAVVSDVSFAKRDHTTLQDDWLISDGTWKLDDESGYLSVDPAAGGVAAMELVERPFRNGNNWVELDIFNRDNTGAGLEAAQPELVIRSADDGSRIVVKLRNRLDGLGDRVVGHRIEIHSLVNDQLTRETHFSSTGTDADFTSLRLRFSETGNVVVHVDEQLLHPQLIQGGAPVIISTDSVVEFHQNAVIGEEPIENAPQLVRFAAGHLIQQNFQYDAMGRLKSQSDPQGVTTRNEYDKKGRLLTATVDSSPVAHVTKYAYDSTGRLTASTDALGQITRTYYDHRDRPVQTLFADGTTVISTLDSAGRQVAATDTSGNTNEFIYDEVGRLVTSIDPLGNSSHSFYDDFSQVVAALAPTNEASETTQESYVASYQVPVHRLSLYPLEIQSDGPGLRARVLDRSGTVRVQNPQRSESSVYFYLPAGHYIHPNHLPTIAIVIHGSQLRVFMDNTQLSRSSTTYDPRPVQLDQADRPSGTKTTNHKLVEFASSQFVHDKAGRIIKQSSHDTSTDTLHETGSLLVGPTTFDYDAIGNVVRTTTHNRFDESDQFTSWARYNSWGNRIASIDNSGVISTSTFDAAGRLTSSTDPLERTTMWEYDNLGRTKRVSDPDPDGDEILISPTTTYRYSSRGELLSETDQLGRKTEYQYDDLGRQTRVKLPDPDGDDAHLDSSVIRSTYDLMGNLLTTTDESDTRAVVTEFKYDEMYRVTDTIHDSGGPDEMVSTNEYDFDGRLELTKSAYDSANLTSSSPRQGIMKYEYDELNRVIATTLIDAHSTNANPKIPLRTETTYAPNGLVVASTIVDTDGHGTAWNVLVGDRTTTYRYDVRGRLLSTKLPNGDTTYQTYDGFGRSHSVVDAAGNATTYAYDSQGFVETETDHSGDVTLYNYHDNGTLKSVTDRNQRTRTFEYDDLDRMVHEHWLDDNSDVIQTYNWAYNDAGLLQSAGDSSQIYTYRYDDLNRRKSAARLDNDVDLTFSFADEYDQAGNVFQRFSNPASPLMFVTDIFEYDRLDRPTKITRTNLFGGHNLRVNYGYDNAGNRSFISRHESANRNTPYETVVNTSISHDRAGRVSAIYHRKSTNQQLSTFTYTYDAANLLRQWADPYQTKRFTYDDAGQLDKVHAKIDGTFTLIQDYEYLDGNLTSSKGSAPKGRTYAVDPENRVGYQAGVGSVEAYAYDREGNLLHHGLTPGGPPHTTYTWDHRNRLTEVVSIKDGVPASVKFEYDVHDQLIAKHVDTDGDGTIDTAERYIYNNGNLVFVFDDILLKNEETPVDSLKHRYFHGVGVDELLADEHFLTLPERPDDQTWQHSSNVHWTLTDHLNSTRLLVDFNHDTGQANRIKSLAYSEFGEVVDDTAPNIDYRFGFTGRAWDNDVELAYHRARWYAPERGRWISEDPSGFDSGDANFYRYVGNNPVSFVDPSGLVQASPVDLLSGQVSDAVQRLRTAEATRESLNFWNFEAIANADAQIASANLQLEGLHNRANQSYSFHRSEFNSQLGAAGSGAITGARAATNGVAAGVVSTGSFGFYNDFELLELSKYERDIGGDLVAGGFQVLTEAGIGVGTGALGSLGKGGRVVQGLGRAAFAFDVGGNIASTGHSAYDIRQNGLTLSNAVGVIGGLAGVSGNAIGFLRNAPKGLTNAADDALHIGQSGKLELNPSLLDFDTPIAGQSGLQEVSRWGRPGLQADDWVQLGGPTRLNYVLTGKWQPGFGNRFTPFKDGESFLVPHEQVVWPSGWGVDGAWKGLFNQRIYVGAGP